MVVYQSCKLFAKSRYSFQLLFFPPIVRHVPLQRRPLIFVAVCCIKISRAHTCTTPRYRCALLIDGLNESLRFVAWYQNAFVIRIIGVHFRKDYSFYIVRVIFKAPTCVFVRKFSDVLCYHNGWSLLLGWGLSWKYDLKKKK